MEKGAWKIENGVLCYVMNVPSTCTLDQKKPNYHTIPYHTPRNAKSK